MSRILKVSQSDYRVKVADGGTITLDTGSEEGLVLITGNLTVLGNTTSIDTQQMVVEDNILTLNREVDADAFLNAVGADFREGTGRPCYIPSHDFIAMPAFDELLHDSARTLARQQAVSGRPCARRRRSG